jgi:hypothetical protein
VTELFAHGHVVDLIIGLIVVEAVVLAAVRRATGHGVGAADLVSNLLAGGCLLLALRAALVGAGWGVIAVCLVAALLAHVADLRRRWR